MTVAVYGTVWPLTDGFTDESTTVAVAPWLTVCVRTDDVLTWKFVLPP